MNNAGLCAVVLAAGYGTRLRPLTEIRPKSLCPINNVPLLNLALDSVRPFADDIAVNVHYLAEQVIAHLDGVAVTISDERPLILGSAGALGLLREWINGRAVLVRNSDAFLTAGLDELVDGWDGLRPRLLGRERDGASDFGNVQYIGACLLPAHVVLSLAAEPASLYDLIWKPAWNEGSLEFVMTSGEFVDCGTPHDYLAANMLASDGHNVIGAGSVVEGSLERVVVWPGGVVASNESLSNCIRVGSDLTVDAR